MSKKVYIYSPYETDTGKEFRKQLKKIMKKYKFEEKDTVKPANIPLVVIVQNFSRIGTDIDSVVEQAQKETDGKQETVKTGLPGDINKNQVAIVVLHVTAKHALPSLPPTSTLSDDKYNYGCMVDFFFMQNDGIYSCGLNDEASSKLKDFLTKVTTYTSKSKTCTLL